MGGTRGVYRVREHRGLHAPRRDTSWRHRSCSNKGRFRQARSVESSVSLSVRPTWARDSFGEWHALESVRLNILVRMLVAHSRAGACAYKSHCTPEPGCVWVGRRCSSVEKREKQQRCSGGYSCEDADTKQVPRRAPTAGPRFRVNCILPSRCPRWPFRGAKWRTLFCPRTNTPHLKRRTI